MDNKRALHLFTKTVIDIMFFSGIIVCGLVPYLIYKVSYFVLMLETYPIHMTAVLMLSGILALIILWELRRIFNTLVKTNPFTLENVKSLRIMARASFAISVIYIAKCIFWFTLATVLLIMVFAIAGLFCLVLADVFKQAVAYKEENDLTV